jgi:hypothetical protein
MSLDKAAKRQSDLDSRWYCEGDTLIRVLEATRNDELKSLEHHGDCFKGLNLAKDKLK